MELRYELPEADARNLRQRLKGDGYHAGIFPRRVGDEGRTVTIDCKDGEEERLHALVMERAPEAKRIL